ncbi:MAG: acetyl/propionyl/methylcrotonyl-CoA carboxylase subunit alpha [Candidatus Bathyarchaeia archaeon]
MFSKVLIANRGEIATRIIRACKELGVKTVAIYSAADVDTLHVKRADESYYVGLAPPAESYLNIERIIELAKSSGAEAIHPGYGFLSQNPTFAEKCAEESIIFVGPSPSSLHLLGNKLEARNTAINHGVNVIPGATEPIKNTQEALTLAQKLGYPVFIKAVFGGGGRGIRLVRGPSEMESAFDICSVEAQESFGNSMLYVEKLIEDARHIEFQIMADQRGDAVHLFERECSIQRRHQKIIEESPSSALTDELRKSMAEAAIRTAKAASYTNAGTVEFLLDRNRNFYFLEMNTRLQVEHLVTEMVTGIDIVKAQLSIASGEPLPWKQSEIRCHGWAINSRVNAEEPSRNFAPSPGKVSEFHSPSGPGIRIDTALYRGAEISIFYDSLLAKVTAWGRTRSEAITRLLAALDDLVIEGMPTNISIHKKILNHETFQAGKIDIGFLQKQAADLFREDEVELLDIMAICASVAMFSLPSPISPVKNKTKSYWSHAGRKHHIEAHNVKRSQGIEGL